MPCSKVFEMVPTDQGMCCAFNLNKAEKMFKDGKFREMVQKLQLRDMNLSFDKVSSSLDKNIDLTTEAGISKGLQVILDAHSNLVAGGSVPGDFYGFYAIIESKDQYPMMSRKSIFFSFCKSLRLPHSVFSSCRIWHVLQKLAEYLVQMNQIPMVCYFYPSL